MPLSFHTVQRTLGVLALICIAGLSACSCGRATRSEIHVDMAGHIFVCNSDGLRVFSYHIASPRKQQSEGVVQKGACPLAVAPNGRLFVPTTDERSRGELAVYALDRQRVVRRIGVVRLPSGPSGTGGAFAISSHGMLFEPRGKALYEYRLDGSQYPRLVSKIQGPDTGLTNPLIVAGAAGRVCAVNFAADTTSSIDCFNDASSGNVKPTQTIAGPKTNLISVNGLAFSSDGSLIVLCNSPDRIMTFSRGAHGDAAPIAVISGSATGLEGSDAVAADVSGNVYAANIPVDTVTVYARGSKGNQAPIYTVTGPGQFAFQPDSLAVDRSETLLVGDGANAKLFTFDLHSDGEPSLRSTLDAPCIALQIYSGCEPKLALAPDGGAYARVGIGSFAEFHRDGAGTYKRRSLVHTLGYPDHLAIAAVDTAGKLFVASNSADVYAFGRDPLGAENPTWAGFLPAAADDIEKMAVSANGEIYFPAEKRDALIRLSTSASGQKNATVTISGVNTGLSQPSGVAVDRNGVVYVAEYGSDAITEFGPRSSGDAKPIATIQGPKTMLDHPNGVAVGSDGTVYVVNGNEAVSSSGDTRTATITIFSPHAVGDVAPRSMIEFSQSVDQGCY
jgi:hypothetical protein